MLNPFSAQSNNKKIDNKNQNLIQQKNKINLSSEKQESNVSDTLLLKIDKDGFFAFLLDNLDQWDCDCWDGKMSFSDHKSVYVTVNDQIDYQKSDSFKLDCDNRYITAIILKYEKNISQLYLTVYDISTKEPHIKGKDDREPLSIQLNLKKDQDGNFAFFYRNKKTSIEITVDKEISQTQNNNQEFSDIPNLEPSPGLSIKYIK